MVGVKTRIRMRIDDKDDKGRGRTGASENGMGLRTRQALRLNSGVRLFHPPIPIMAGCRIAKRNPTRPPACLVARKAAPASAADELVNGAAGRCVDRLHLPGWSKSAPRHLDASSAMRCAPLVTAPSAAIATLAFEAPARCPDAGCTAAAIVGAAP